MRPLLIFDYESKLLKKKDEFLDLFMKEGDQWEKTYLEDNGINVEETRAARG